MTYDQAKVRALYKKLLTLYPRAFREQLGESMAQTFRDMYAERKQQTERGLFRFTIWLFVETAIGIIKEHVIQFTQGDTMKNFFSRFRSAAIISSILVLPFVILEFVFNIVNKPAILSLKQALDLTVLFGLLWLLPVLFMTILSPIVRNLRAGNGLMANPVHLLFRVVLMAFFATAWGGILIDQFPCFIGIPNCD